MTIEVLEGQVVDGKISRNGVDAMHGLYVDLPDGRRGLVHLKYLPGATMKEREAALLNYVDGDCVRVFVRGIRSSNGKSLIDLSLQQFYLTQVQENTLVTATIFRKGTRYAICTFSLAGLSLSGKLDWTELCGKSVSQRKSHFQSLDVGAQVHAAIQSVDVTKNSIVLSERLSQHLSYVQMRNQSRKACLDVVSSAINCKRHFTAHVVSLHDGFAKLRIFVTARDFLEGKMEHDVNSNSDLQAGDRLAVVPIALEGEIVNVKSIAKKKRKLSLTSL